MNRYQYTIIAAGLLAGGGCHSGPPAPRQTCARAQLAVQSYEECLSRTNCHTTPHDTYVYHSQGRWLMKHCTEGED